MTTHTYMDLSTGHIEKEDAAALSTGVDGLIYYPYEEGYFIHVPGEPSDLVETIGSLHTAGLTPALGTLLLAAHSAGHALLRLDRDGETDEQFQKFNW